MMTLTDEPRPCIAKGARALFHGWVNLEKPCFEGSICTGYWRGTVAMVEYMNGTVEHVSARDIRFLDGEAVFARYDWGDADG